MAKCIPAESAPVKDPVAKVTRLLLRPDGSEVKIVASCEMVDPISGVEYYVLRRSSPRDSWKLCSNTPHPRWLEMPDEEYIKYGRSEMLRTVTIGELLKAGSLLGKSLSSMQMEELNSFRLGNNCYEHAEVRDDKR